MRRLSAALLALWFIFFTRAATALAQAEGDIAIMVVDGQGKAIPSMVGKAVGLRGGADITSHFDGLRGTHIPYGTYDLILFRTPLDSLSVPIQRRVDVKQLNALYIVVAPRIEFASRIAADVQPPRGYEILGQIEPYARDSEPMWIRLVPIIGNAPIIDIEVNSSGEFHIYQALGGRYLALVLRGGKILDAQEIVFERSSTGLQSIVLILSNHTPSLAPKPQDLPKQ